MADERVLGGFVSELGGGMGEFPSELDAGAHSGHVHLRGAVVDLEIMEFPRVLDDSAEGIGAVFLQERVGILAGWHLAGANEDAGAGEGGKGAER